MVFSHLFYLLGVRTCQEATVQDLPEAEAGDAVPAAAAEAAAVWAEAVVVAWAASPQDRGAIAFAPRAARVSRIRLESHAIR